MFGAAEAFPALESQTFAKLEGVELSATQTAGIKALVLEFGPRIAALETQAALTQSQRDDRASAIQRALAEGKRGVDARQLIARSGALTAAQKSAGGQLVRLYDEFDRAVQAILTDTQRARLLRTATAQEHAAAPKRSGFIIMRLSEGLSHVSKGGRRGSRFHVCREATDVYD